LPTTNIRILISERIPAPADGVSCSAACWMLLCVWLPYTPYLNHSCSRRSSADVTL